MAKRKQRRKTEKQQRHAPKPVHLELGAAVERLVYSREQAARALGISLATLDRCVVPVVATVKTESGARLIPAGELERYLAERIEQPRTLRRRPSQFGRVSRLPCEVVERISREHAHGASLAEIARRLNRDEIPTG